MSRYIEITSESVTGGLVLGVADQPPPRPSTGAEVWPEVIAAVRTDGHRVPDLVIIDMHVRDQMGRDQYGTPLRRGEGPCGDHGVAAYRAALDLCAYAASQWGVQSLTAREARRMVAVMRQQIVAPCGACGSLRSVGSAVCSRCGATCR